MPWLLLVIVVGGVVAIVLLLRTRFVHRRPDVGAVSDRWVAAHRSEEQDQ